MMEGATINGHLCHRREWEPCHPQEWAPCHPKEWEPCHPQEWAPPRDASTWGPPQRLQPDPSALCRCHEANGRCVGGLRDAATTRKSQRCRPSCPSKGCVPPRSSAPPPGHDSTTSSDKRLEGLRTMHVQPLACVAMGYEPPAPLFGATNPDPIKGYPTATLTLGLTCHNSDIGNGLAYPRM